MLTKRLSWPGSLKRRLSMPSNLAVSSPRSSATVPGLSSTRSTPLVRVRRGVGIRTLTGMWISVSSFFGRPLAAVLQIFHVHFDRRFDEIHHLFDCLSDSDATW